MKKLIGCNDDLFSWLLHPNQLFEYGLELGFPNSDFLNNSKLAINKIHDLDYKISWNQFNHIAQYMDKHGPEDWGFQLGKRLPLGSHGLTSLVIMNCISWPQIMEAIIKYTILVTPLLYVEVKSTKKHYYVTIHPEFTRDPLILKFIECFFTIMYHTISQIGDVDYKYQPDEVCIMMKGAPPSYHKYWKTYFHENIQWNNYTNQMRFHKNLVNKEITTANPIAANNMRRVLESQLDQLPAKKGGLHELRDLFLQGIFRQDDCAKALLTSSATFKRYLKSSNTSFTQELTCFRMEEAAWEAMHGSRSVAQISDQLGFQDVASFRRLFKKETKMSFLEFRHAFKNNNLNY